MNCEYVFDFINEMVLTLAYPLLVWLSCVWYFSFVMIINLLMWAEARGSHGQQGNGDSAA